MAYTFGDSFDCYATPADAIVSYWDSGLVGSVTLVSGRFTGGRAIQWIAGANLIKSSGANDTLHHVVVAFQQTAAISGANLGAYISFYDGATPQCSVVFRSDGAILLTAGGPTGTVLATYSGATTLQSQWFAYEIEVVVSNTVGGMRVRKNGSASNDYDSFISVGNLDTAATANNYANKIQVGQQATVALQLFDDLLWRSDASSVAWIGDVRCYTRMPASDAAVQFSRAPTSVSVPQSTAQTTTASKAANAGMMSAFTPTFSGTISTGTVSVLTGGTGNMKAAIYDATRTTVLATSNSVVNPTSGSNAITFGTPLTVVAGTVYYLAVDQDFSIVYNSTGLNQYSFTTTFASFPAASPATAASANGPVVTLNITLGANYATVSEAQQDGTTSYVYDGTVGHGDLYGIASIAGTPASVVAVTTRAFMQIPDSGPRGAAMQLKSGSTTVQAPALLTVGAWSWAWRTDVTDPATGSAWAPSAVNSAQIGPVITS
jgi:hypothetical protein